MSDTTVAVPPQTLKPGAWTRSARDGLKQRWMSAAPLKAPPRSEWPAALRRVRTVGFVLLGVQFVVACWWTSVMSGRFALTFDMGTHAQATYLISRGIFWPFCTLQNFPYFYDHGEILFWLFGIPNLITQSPLVLYWPQNAAIVGSEAIAFAWMCELVAQRRRPDSSVSLSVSILVLGLILLIPNPWIWWTVSFDIHTEPFAVFFAICAAWMLYTGRKGLWVFVVLGLLSGDVGVTYLFAVALSAALCGRYALKRSIQVGAVCIVWLALLTVTHGNQGDALNQYTYIINGHWVDLKARTSLPLLVKGALTHPGRVFHDLWVHRTNIWANASPTGLLGWLWPATLVPSALALLESQLGYTNNFAAPFFQEFVLYIFSALGTVAILATVAPRLRPSRRWIAWLAIGALTVNAVMWAVVWVPQTPKRWLTVSPQAAAVLKRVSLMIRPQDEVDVANGVVGRFSDHKYAYYIGGSTKIMVPVKAKRIWIILAPSQGIETASPSEQMAAVGTLLHTPGARLVAGSSGIYAFEWTPKPGTRHPLALGTKAEGPSFPAWIAAGAAGRPVKPTATHPGYASSGSEPGYVVDKAYWRKPAGTYEAQVALSVSGVANVELWDADAKRLLARKVVGRTNGIKTVSITAALSHLVGDQVFSGWGIWRDAPQVLPGDNLEIRVWSPGGRDQVRVYRVALGAAPH